VVYGGECRRRVAVSLLVDERHACMTPQSAAGPRLAPGRPAGRLAGWLAGG